MTFAELFSMLPSQVKVQQKFGQRNSATAFVETLQRLPSNFKIHPEYSPFEILQLFHKNGNQFEAQIPCKHCSSRSQDSSPSRKQRKEPF